MGTTRPTADLILQEARSIIEERGEAGLRVSDLAERCGVAVGLLYHYFADREAIIAAVREAQFVARVEDDILGLQALSKIGSNDLIRDVIVTQFADPRNTERLGYRLQRMEVLVTAARNGELLSAIRDVQTRLTDEIIEAIRYSKKNGLVADDVDERSLAFFLEVIPIGTALGLAYGDNLPDPARWDAFVRRVLQSLSPEDS